MPQQTKTQEILRQSLDRNRYFYGKLMTVRDFTQEQAYFNAKRWIVNRLLFGAGVICGLQVTASKTAASIGIAPGVAFDPLGREVTVPEIPGGYEVDLNALKPPPTRNDDNKKKGFICLAYHDCPKDPVPSLESSPCEESCESNRWSETFEVMWEEDANTVPAPSLCEAWLNRATVAADDGMVRVERTAPLWVRENETFEVVVRVTNIQKAADAKAVQLNESVTDGSLIEPTPPDLPAFPTPPINLRPGEFFVYVYQVRAGDAGADVFIRTDSPPFEMGSPPVVLASKIEVVTQPIATEREREFNLETHAGEPKDTCVRIAELTVSFDEAGRVFEVVSVENLPAPRFRYSLERVTEMLDCVRASLLSEAGSPRPGHAFITFKDLETKDPKPIGKTATPGNSFTVPRGDHTHELPLVPDGGLVFEPDGRLLIEGKVLGTTIDFLSPVSGQDPTSARHLVTKQYLDAHIAGLDWQESVLDKDLTAPPGEIKTEEAAPKKSGKKEPKGLVEDTSSKVGDRYLLFNEPEKGTSWAGHRNDIATFDGQSWDFATPDAGTAVFVEDEGLAYLFTVGDNKKKAVWVPFLTTPDVAAGAGLVVERGATLRVNVGLGLAIENDAVKAVFADGTAPVGDTAIGGSASALSREDHVHVLPLQPDGGLVFSDGQLGINGPVSGEKIEFQRTVSGTDPTADRHLATKRYIDNQPKIQAGSGLLLDKNVMSVVAGPGIEVKDQVNVAFEPNTPQAIGPVAHAGKLDTVSRGDHVHTLSLRKGSGLILDDTGLRIDGPVAGGEIQFANTVSGQDPTEDQDLATKKYVDSQVPPPATIGAGRGLFIDKDGTLAVGVLAGLTVNDDDVSVIFETQDPQPMASTPTAGKANTVSHGDHVHSLPVNKESGLVVDDRGLRIEGPVAGNAINFLNPVSGVRPREAEHLATRAYVDENRGNEIGAGGGLFLDEGGAVSVGTGDGIIVGQDTVAVRYFEKTPSSDSLAGDAGSALAAAHGDHSHPFPIVTPGAASGVATVKIDSPEFFVVTDLIDPGLGEGIISVQLALLIGQNYFFNVEGVPTGLPPIHLGSEVDLRGTSRFKIWAWSGSNDQLLPSTFEVRWFAYRPAIQAPPVTVIGLPTMKPAPVSDVELRKR